jgi:hypothetical protein
MADGPLFGETETVPARAGRWASLAMLAVLAGLWCAYLIKPLSRVTLTQSAGWYLQALHYLLTGSAR